MQGIPSVKSEVSGRRTGDVDGPLRLLGLDRKGRDVSTQPDQHKTLSLSISCLGGTVPLVLLIADEAFAGLFVQARSARLRTILFPSNIVPHVSKTER